MQILVVIGTVVNKTRAGAVRRSTALQAGAVIWNFSFTLFSGRIMALGSTQPVTERSVNNIALGGGGGKRRPVFRVDNSTIFMCPLSGNLGVPTSWNLQVLSWPVQGLLHPYDCCDITYIQAWQHAKWIHKQILIFNKTIFFSYVVSTVSAWIHFHELTVIKLHLATVLFTYSKHIYLELILYTTSNIVIIFSKPWTEYGRQMNPFRFYNLRINGSPLMLQKFIPHSS